MGERKPPPKMHPEDVVRITSFLDGVISKTHESLREDVLAARKELEALYKDTLRIAKRVTELEQQPHDIREGFVNVVNPVDPWAGRSEGMRCRTCIWYAPKGEGAIGRCRRHAPTMGGYPVVYPTDWCGDHRIDEGKGGYPAVYPTDWYGDHQIDEGKV